MTLGIFDSGIGGLSLVKELLNIGFTDFIYLKDSKNFPYGLKNKDTLLKIGSENIKLLLQKGAKKIVIACHTMSNAASEEFKTIFPSLQILDILNPTLNYLENLYPKKHILLMGTDTTINLGIYKNKLNNLHTFYEVKASDLTKAIENYNIEAVKALILNKTTRYIKQHPDIDTILLACTHFSLIKEMVQRYNPTIRVLDTIDLLLKEVKKIINHQPTHNNQKILPKYYTTQKTVNIITLNNSNNYNNSNELKKLDCFKQGLVKKFLLNF